MLRRLFNTVLLSIFATGRTLFAQDATTHTKDSLDTVKDTVAAHFGLSVAELVSASRLGRVAWPRQLAMHLARELTGAPLTAIGSAFGGRNHATVLHSCGRVAQRAQSDPQAAVEIDELTRSLRAGVGDRAC